VNLTDGLDASPNAGRDGGGGARRIAYVNGNIKFAAYLQIPTLPGSARRDFKRLSVGAGLGFWVQLYPDQVFMGDVGALS